MSDTDIFLKNIINKKVKLSPDKLHKNFKKELLNKLKNTLENKYSKYGLVKENSIEIIKYSIGTLEHNSLQGNIIYNVQFSVLVCNPVIGNIIKCKVFNSNNFGILCKDIKYSIIEIIVPKKTLAIQSDVPLNNIKVDDIVYIEIIGKKPLLNDKKINCIGKIKRTNKINNNNNTTEKDNTIILQGDNEYDEIIGNDDDSDDDTDDDGLDGGGYISSTCDNDSLLSVSDLSDNLSELSENESEVISNK
jgi:DNA-directed RNA polymerase subunit E'/Rpb7